MATMEQQEQDTPSDVQNSEDFDWRDVQPTAIDALTSNGVASTDVEKLKQAGIHTIQGLLLRSMRDLTAQVKGVSEAKLQKVIDVAKQANNMGAAIQFVAPLDLLPPVPRPCLVSIIDGVDQSQSSPLWLLTSDIHPRNSNLARWSQRPCAWAASARDFR